jgi:hypothetical protein
MRREGPPSAPSRDMERCALYTPRCSFCLRLSHKSGVTPPLGLRTRRKMSRSKAFGRVSETNQSPRNGPLGAAADICDSLA